MQIGSKDVTRRGRVLAAAVTLVATAALLAGCGDDSEDAAPATSESAAAYPVTITHKLGSTKVEKAPQRIVTLSDTDLDALLLLGLQPVGIAESSGPDGITPWAKPLLKDKPKVLTPGDNGYNVEEVLALNPDLILAGGDYYIADQYAKYSALVPTTSFETAAFEDSWQTTLRQVGKAVGRSSRAEEIVKEVEGKIAKVKSDAPAIVGKTFSLTQVWEAGSVGVLRSKNDTGVKMLNDFGLTLAPTVAALPGDELSVQLSLEQLATLEADLVLVYYVEDGFKTALEANTSFKNLNAVKRGAYAPLTLEQFSSLRTSTPLSVPYLIENIVPLLTKAAQAK